MKNIESLEVYFGYKEFLDQLAQNIPMTKEEREEEERQMAKREKQEADQRKKAQSDKLKQQKMQQQHGGKGQKKPNEKGKGQEGGKGLLGDSIDLELNIPPELQRIIEDDDNYMPLRFNNESELMEIFSTLEEQNLFLI